MKGTAIVTKFLGPTNLQGSRVKATLPSGKSVIINWASDLDSTANHNRAAAACYQKHYLDSYLQNSDMAPDVKMTREIHGFKSGYVVIVDMITKDKAIQY